MVFKSFIQCYWVFGNRCCVFIDVRNKNKILEWKQKSQWQTTQNLSKQIQKNQVGQIPQQAK